MGSFPSILMASINIEGSRHIEERVRPFLYKTLPSVLCVQELYEPDIPRLEEVVGPCIFAPTARVETPCGIVTEGLGIFSRLPVERHSARQYYGCDGPLPVFDKTSLDTRAATRRYVVELVSFRLGAAVFRIATTHFPWTPGGTTDEHQHRAVERLFKELSGEPPCVLCGDFNAPRGGEIFSRLAARWLDNIPLLYTTSLDPVLHRAAAKRPPEIEGNMVDGLFTDLRAYRATSVKLHSGVSDHRAVCGVITFLPRVG